MTLKAKNRAFAILLGSTALATTLSFDVVARSSVEMGIAVEGIDIQRHFTAKSSVFDQAVDTQVDTSQTIVNPFQHRPVVMVDEDGTKHINPIVQGVKQDMLMWNALSYAVAKRQSASDKLNRLVAARNSTVEDVELFMAEMEQQFGGIYDFSDEFYVYSLDERKAHLTKEIATLEAYIQGQMRDERNIAQKLLAKGWDAKPFEGKSGYRRVMGDPGDSWVDDDRGFIAYHKEKNIIMVVMHGSRDGSDWTANFDGMKVRASECGLHLPGNPEIHRGFGNLVSSCIEAIHKEIRAFHEKVPEDERQGTKILVTGHSLGAALGTLVEFDLAANLAPDLFGEGYDNTKSNNIGAYIYSAPRALSKEGVKIMEEVVGQDNTLRQNVQGDPVPVAALKSLEDSFKHIFRIIEGGRAKGETAFAKVPFIGSWLEEKVFSILSNNPQFKVFLEHKLEDAMSMVSGYDSVGHLALDDTGATLTRMLLPATKAFFKRTAANFKGVFKGYYGAIMGNGAPNPGFASFLSTTLYDLAATGIAPLHYGTTLVGDGGAFDYHLPSLDTDKLLKRGAAHEQGKNNPLKATKGFVATTVDSLKTSASNLWKGVKSWF